MVTDNVGQPGVVGGRLAGLVSSLMGRLGKGEGFFTVAFVQAAGLLTLAYLKPESNWAGFAVALGAVNVPYFGGGGWKAHSEAKSVNGAGPPPA